MGGRGAGEENDGGGGGRERKNRMMRRLGEGYTVPSWSWHAATAQASAPREDRRGESGEFLGMGMGLRVNETRSATGL